MKKLLLACVLSVFSGMTLALVSPYIAHAEVTICGDDTIDAGELCDGTSLGGATCGSIRGNSYVGELRCGDRCMTYITTGCTEATGCSQLTTSSACNGSSLGCRWDTDTCLKKLPSAGKPTQCSDITSALTCNGSSLGCRWDNGKCDLKTVADVGMLGGPCAEGGQCNDDANECSAENVCVKKGSNDGASKEGDGGTEGSGGKEGAGDGAGAGDVGEVPAASDILIYENPLEAGGRVNRGELSPVVKGITSIRGLTGAILIFVLSFVGVIALLVIVYAGLRYITAFGESTEKAKSMITAAIIGIVIIMGAWALVTTVLNLGAG